MPFSTLPSFGKVAKKVATFNLLPNFDSYIRNPAKILACQNLVRLFFGIKVNRPKFHLLVMRPLLYFYLVLGKIAILLSINSDTVDVLDTIGFKGHFLSWKSNEFPW
jgi:hypothetical protein